MKSERNVDKLRRLQKEMEALEERRKAAVEEIRRVRRELHRKDDAINALCLEHGAIMVAVALKHGTQVGSGAHELVYAKLDPRACEEQYRFQHLKEGEENYILRVEEIKAQGEG